VRLPTFGPSASPRPSRAVVPNPTHPVARVLTSLLLPPISPLQVIPHPSAVSVREDAPHSRLRALAAARTLSRAWSPNPTEDLPSCMLTAAGLRRTLTES
jgi:hypothetical protein